jgi:hypothetical protein
VSCISSTSRLKLATRRDVERRLWDIIELYKGIFGEAFFLGERVYEPTELTLTQEYVESDKLALVLKSALLEGYTAPIIVVMNRSGNRYVVDGHHRTIVSAWLRRKIAGYVILVPNYTPRISRSLLEVDTINPPDTPLQLSCWRHAVNVIRFLEKQHGTVAWTWLEKLPVKALKPTEPPLGLFLPGPMQHDCPILVYAMGSEYYVVDGHHRVCSALAARVEKMPALVFTLENREIGLIKTARKLGYACFDSDYCSGMQDAFRVL